MVDAILGCCRGDDFKPKVSLQIGKIIGSTRETKNGTEYVSFVGIPYAEPPVGKQNTTSKLIIYKDKNFFCSIEHKSIVIVY